MYFLNIFKKGPYEGRGAFLDLDFCNIFTGKKLDFLKYFIKGLT